MGREAIATMAVKGWCFNILNQTVSKQKVKKEQMYIYWSLKLRITAGGLSTIIVATMYSLALDDCHGITNKVLPRLR